MGNASQRASGAKAQTRGEGPSNGRDRRSRLSPRGWTDEPVVAQSARERPQTDAIPTAARTASGPRPAEGLRNHVGNRFTSAIGLTRVEDRWDRRRRESDDAHRAATDGAAQRGRRGGFLGLGTGGLQGEERPVEHRDQPPYRLQYGATVGAEEPEVADFLEAGRQDVLEEAADE